jgi:hypothetical protein
VWSTRHHHQNLAHAPRALPDIKGHPLSVVGSYSISVPSRHGPYPVPLTLGRRGEQRWPGARLLLRALSTTFDLGEITESPQYLADGLMNPN